MEKRSTQPVERAGSWGCGTKAADVVYDITLTVRDVLRQAVPSMFFSVAVGYVTLAVLLVSYFPLRRWTQNALKKKGTRHYVLNLMYLNFFNLTLSFYILSAFERCYLRAF